MKFVNTKLDGVILIEPDIHRDTRGLFYESYQREKFISGGITANFVQSNHSRSVIHCLRGLHAQIRHPQGKLVRVISGAIFDVAVDIRPDSLTFCQWVGFELSDENFLQLYIPPGLAHGFCVLSAHAEVEYMCTSLYQPDDQLCIRWDDPDLNVEWPIDNPILSPQDASAPSLRDVVADFN